MMERRRGIGLALVWLAAIALGAAGCSGGEGSGVPTTRGATLTTTAPAGPHVACTEPSPLFEVSAFRESPASDCEDWVERSIGRTVRASTGSASVWSRRTDNGTALIVGAVHTLGQGWFGPAGSEIPEAITDPGAQIGIPRLFLVLPDGSGPDPLASPWFGLYHPAVAAERNDNFMRDLLPREDFYVAVTDAQKLDVDGPVPTPDPILHGAVPLYDPQQVTRSAPTYVDPRADDVVLMLGYPNATGELTAAVGRVLSDREAAEAVAALGAVGDPEGNVPYDPEAEMIIEGRAVAGMSGGPVVDRDGRLVGVLVRASGDHDGVAHVRAVRMTYVVSRVAAAFERLPAESRTAVAGYLED